MPDLSQRAFRSSFGLRGRRLTFEVSDDIHARAAWSVSSVLDDHPNKSDESSKDGEGAANDRCERHEHVEDGGVVHDLLQVRPVGVVTALHGTRYRSVSATNQDARGLRVVWQLLHPDAGSDQLARLAANPIPKTVVWLDELQRYLGGPAGLTADTVRDLIVDSGPIVLVGTLWPGRYAVYTTLPRDGAHEDPYRWEREVLDLAEVVTIDTDWSDAELNRAQDAADRDPRVKQAVCLAALPRLRTGSKLRSPTSPSRCAVPHRRLNPWRGPAWERSSATAWQIICSSTPHRFVTANPSRPAFGTHFFVTLMTPPMLVTSPSTQPSASSLITPSPC